MYLCRTRVRGLTVNSQFNNNRKVRLELVKYFKSVGWRQVLRVHAHKHILSYSFLGWCVRAKQAQSILMNSHTFSYIFRIKSAMWLLTSLSGSLIVLLGHENMHGPAATPPLHLADGLARTAAFTASLVAHVGYDEFLLAVGM